MTTEPPDNKTEQPGEQQHHSSEFSRHVGAKAARKLRARQNPTPGLWFGLGMMGLIGWSITVPTLLGVAIGIWLDKVHPGDRSWTLALLVAGLVIGCFNAWHWVDKEDKAMRNDRDEHDE